MLGLSLDIWRGIYGGAAAPATGIITANRQVWLRKGTASGATWPDASGNALDSTLNGAPTIGPTSVTFDGVGQYGVGALGAQCRTLYLRMRQVSWTSGRVIAGGDPNGQLHLRQTGVSPNIEGYDSDLAPRVSSPDATIGTMVSLCIASDGVGNMTLNIDGVEVSFSGAAGDVFTSLSLGGSTVGTLFSNIEVVEAAAYVPVHDAGQRAQMITYMGTL